LLWRALVRPVCGEAHCFEGASALRLQGGAAPPPPPPPAAPGAAAPSAPAPAAAAAAAAAPAAVSVQADHLPALRARAEADSGLAVSPLPPAHAYPGRRGFAVAPSPTMGCAAGAAAAAAAAAAAVVYADAGAALRADPRRVAVPAPGADGALGPGEGGGGQGEEEHGPRCFARSLLAMARGTAGAAAAAAGPLLASAAEARLAELQRETSAQNLAAWGAGRGEQETTMSPPLDGGEPAPPSPSSSPHRSSTPYAAWVARLGPPAAQAAAVAADPAARLGLPLLRALLPPLEAAAAAGRAPRAANLMGSHGGRALALASLPLPCPRPGARGAGARGAEGSDGRRRWRRAEVLVVDGSDDNARYGREMVVAAAALAAAEAEAAAAASAASAGAAEASAARGPPPPPSLSPPPSVAYLVADVLDAGRVLGGGRERSFDAVFFELGCLHYFLDPLPLFIVCARLLRRRDPADDPGACPSRLVVRDFHPVAAKLFAPRSGGGRSAAAADAAPGGAARDGGGGAAAAAAARQQQRRVEARRALRKGRGAAGARTGDYFDERLVETSVAFTKHTAALAAAEGGGGGSGEQAAAGAADDADAAVVAAESAAAVPIVRLRQHTLGDIVTAAARAGLVIESLEEEAGPRLIEDAGIPKLFTLVCRLDEGPPPPPPPPPTV